MRVRYWFKFFWVVLLLLSGVSCRSMKSQSWQDYFEKTYGGAHKIPPNGSSSVTQRHTDKHEEFDFVDLEKYERIKDKVYQEFLENPPEVIKKHGIVLFSDIRNFTDLCERFLKYDREKSESVWIPFYCKFKGKFLRGRTGKLKKFTIDTFLYFYQNILHAILHENNGVIKNYMGDGIFAGFFDKKKEKLEELEELEDNSCYDAVESGIAMIMLTKLFEVGSKKRGWTKLGCGVGIHMGSISVMQRDNRLIHISGALNTCSRVEQLTKCLWMYKNPTYLPLLLTAPIYNRLKLSRRMYFSYTLEPFMAGVGRYLLYGWDGSKPQKPFLQSSYLSRPMFPYRWRKKADYHPPGTNGKKTKVRKEKKLNKQMFDGSISKTVQRLAEEMDDLQIK